MARKMQLVVKNNKWRTAGYRRHFEDARLQYSAANLLFFKKNAASGFALRAHWAARAGLTFQMRNRVPSAMMSSKMRVSFR